MRSRRLTFAFICALMATHWSGAADLGLQHTAHQHGVSKLGIAVEGDGFTVHLESPLANIVGFEHAPRKPREREAARKALGRLKQGGRLFEPTPDAACKPASSKVDAPVLEGRGKAGAHADLDADYRFVCAKPELLKGLDTRLFSVFSGIRQIEAVVVTEKSQQVLTLVRQLHYISW